MFLSHKGISIYICVCVHMVVCRAPTSSNPISKRHSTAPFTGRSLVENVGFPIRIDLYLSSFGFLQKNIHTQDQTRKLNNANAIEITCIVEMAYNIINVEKWMQKTRWLYSLLSDGQYIFPIIRRNNIPPALWMFPEQFTYLRILSA